MQIHNQGAVLVLSAVLCLLPIIFYAANRLYSEKDEHTFLQGRDEGMHVAHRRISIK